MFSLSWSKLKNGRSRPIKTVQRFRWWIDEPVITGSANPTDGDLQELRAKGFTIAVSLLVESEQLPRYDKQSAVSAGWSIHSIPIEEGVAPSLEQIRDFMNLLETVPAGTKVVVFCESGKGRTACMAAAYWVNKGFSASDSNVRMSEACATSEWVTAERRRVLEEFIRRLSP